jgi:hypothetical protein
MEAVCKNRGPSKIWVTTIGSDTVTGYFRIWAPMFFNVPRPTPFAWDVAESSKQARWRHRVDGVGGFLTFGVGVDAEGAVDTSASSTTARQGTIAGYSQLDYGKRTSSRSIRSATCKSFEMATRSCTLLARAPRAQ